MARLAKQKLTEHKTLLAGQSDSNLDNLTTQDIFKAYQLKDPIAVKIIQDALAYWGKACANLVSLFNPEIIIFGGGVFGPAQSLLPQIYAEAKKWAQPIAIHQVRFASSQLGSEAGLFGAGYLALK
jgi:glucokinase